MPSDNLTYQPHIPDAVRRASMRADELAREAGVANVVEDPNPPGDNAGNGVAGDQATTVVSPSESGDSRGFDQSTTVVDEPQQPAPSQDDWEQRYNTLQGKYNNEIPELRGQIRSLQDILATLQAAPPPQPLPAPTTQGTPQWQREIPAEDVENYGSDLINGTQRWAEARFTPRFDELERRLLAVEGGTQQMVQLSATQRVEAALARQVPTWETINHDPAFHTWLAQVDPFSGRTRHALLTDAYGSGDSVRTVAFFQAYQREHTAVRPTPGIQAVQTGTPPADRLPLADLAVPGRGTTATPPASGAPDRRIWTTSEITQFYRQNREGRWQGREAEAARIEADIFAAGREGRVRQQ